MQVLIENMTCGSCAKHVTQAIKTVDANAKVAVDVSARKVVVETTAGAQEIEKALAAQGYAARVL